MSDLLNLFTDYRICNFLFEFLFFVAVTYFVLNKKIRMGASHEHSHVNQRSGEDKIDYSRSIQARMAAIRLTLKKLVLYCPYKCPICGKYHIGGYKFKKSDIDVFSFNL